MFTIIAGHTVPRRDQKRVSGLHEISAQAGAQASGWRPSRLGHLLLQVNPLSRATCPPPHPAVLHFQVGGESAGGSSGEKDLCILPGTFSVLKINSGNQDTKLTMVQIRKWELKGSIPEMNTHTLGPPTVSGKAGTRTQESQAHPGLQSKEIRQSTRLLSLHLYNC